MWSSCAWVMTTPTRILLRPLDKAEIGHDEINAGQLLAGKGDAEVDHQPLARACGPIAVKGAIHADLAQAAERREYKLAVVRHLGSALRRVRSRPERRRRGVRSRRKTEVGRLDPLEPALGAQEQATALIDPFENALAPAGAAFDRDALAKTEGAIDPVRANAVERLSSAPRVDRRVKPPGETFEQSARADRPTACGGETRGWVTKPLRRMRAIDADPDRIGGAPAGETNPFDQYAAAFDAVQHQIVRPFEAGVGRAGVPCRADQRHAGDKAELGRERGRTRIDHERGGVKVAHWRDPGATAAAPAGCLFAGDDPQAVRFSSKRAAARFLVRRIDHSDSNNAPSSDRIVQPQGGGQKSDCAAAIAALVIGEGKNTNRMIMSADSASTMRATGPGRSNALAGSSKYISLTILR